MTADEIRARYRTPEQIKSGGAIGNIFDGPEITVHGLATRLLAWPGTGFQTEAVHLTIADPGQASDSYTYDLAEEAFLCRHGEVEVLLRGEWVTLRPGDLAYFPAGVPHALRNTSDRRAYLVNQICPPQFDLYVESGLYNPAWGVMNGEAMAKAKANADDRPVGDLDEMVFRDDQPEFRAQNLPAAEVARAGALFNVLEGSAFTGIGLPMRLVLWPGAGTRLVGFNYAYCGIGVEDTIHTHPVSDEFLVMWSGSGQFFVGDIGWVDAAGGDVALAPCGVAHGHRSIGERGPSMMGGFASPPQMDLVIPTDYYRDGRYRHPTASELTSDEMHATDQG
ncbi:MAG: cupin domain-containing protein [Actinobacteria bacterium]|nr:cupin domain-containing protein [Actinomycetota bacterium]